MAHVMASHISYGVQTVKGKMKHTSCDESNGFLPVLRQDQDSIGLVDLPHVEAEHKAAELGVDCRPDMYGCEDLRRHFQVSISIKTEATQRIEEYRTRAICLSGSPGCRARLMLTRAGAMRNTDVTKPNTVFALRHHIPGTMSFPN